MRQLLASFAVVALLVACDGLPPQRPIATVRTEPVAAAQRYRVEPPLTDEIPGPPAAFLPGSPFSPLSPVSPLPSRAPLYGLQAPAVSEGPVGAPLNRGPVTGYGPGGMVPMPGAPANPPYH